MDAKGDENYPNENGNNFVAFCVKENLCFCDKGGTVGFFKCVKQIIKHEEKMYLNTVFSILDLIFLVF